MLARTLSNKYKLIVKKSNYLSAENVSHLNSDQARVQLELLEQVFEIYNKEFEQLMSTVEDEKIDILLEGLEEVSDIYAQTKSTLLIYINRSEENIKPETSKHDSNAHQLIKLPSINIPTFDGKFKNGILTVINLCQ